MQSSQSLAQLAPQAADDLWPRHGAMRDDRIAFQVPPHYDSARQVAEWARGTALTGMAFDARTSQRRSR